MRHDLVTRSEGGAVEAQAHPIARCRDAPGGGGKACERAVGGRIEIRPGHDPERAAPIGGVWGKPGGPGAPNRVEVAATPGDKLITGPKRPSVLEAELPERVRRCGSHPRPDRNAAGEREVRPHPVHSSREADPGTRRDAVRGPRRKACTVVALDAEVRAAEPDGSRLERLQHAPTDRDLERSRPRRGTGQQVCDGEAPRIAGARQRDTETAHARPPRVLDRQERPWLDDPEHRLRPARTGRARPVPGGPADRDASPTRGDRSAR